MSVWFLLLFWYPAASHLCDHWLCCCSPASAGSVPGQSEAWCLCWSNLQEKRQKERTDININIYEIKALLCIRCFMSMTVCDTSCFLTICFYDYDVLSLIEMVLDLVLFEETDHLADTVQRSIEVGACLISMTWDAQMKINNSTQLILMQFLYRFETL